MTYLTELFAAIRRREEGQTMAEYGVILAVITVLIIGRSPARPPASRETSCRWSASSKRSRNRRGAGTREKWAPAPRHAKQD